MIEPLIIVLLFIIALGAAIGIVMFTLRFTSRHDVDNIPTLEEWKCKKKK